MKKVILLSNVLCFLIMGWSHCAHAENDSFLVFESAKMPSLVIWWSDTERFVEPVAAKELDQFFVGVAQKPKSQGALSYIILEKTSEGVSPISIRSGQILTEKQIEDKNRGIKEVKQQVMTFENIVQSKKVRIAELRRGISEKIPIKEILTLRHEKDELATKKRQLDAEATVVEQSLQNLDRIKIDRDDIASQERLLQQLNQELRIGLDARKSTR